MSKITQLTENTTPVGTDLIEIVDDPGGTPFSQKSTLANATKALSVMVGDSGSGGTKGLVPAPAAGDAAAGRFLKADGTFAVPAGSGIGGSSGATDNALIRADGTGGATVQGSAVTIDDNGAITVPEIAAPGTPASGKVAVYAKSDGKLYIKDDAGTETDLAGGGGGTPGGSDTQVQFNDGGAFGGDADFTWNKTTNTLTFGNTGAGFLGNFGDQAQIGNTASLGIAGFRTSRDGQLQFTSGVALPGTVDVGVRRISGGYGVVIQSGSDANNSNPDNQRFIFSKGHRRCTANTAKTNTTLATITGCSVPLVTGGSETLNFYTFIFEAEVDCDATGGYKFAVAYSGTLDAGITYFVEVVDEADGSRDAFSRQTASGGAVGGAGPTAIHVRIVGNISIANNGNLTIQFAQNAASGTSTVLALGSKFDVDPVIN